MSKSPLEYLRHIQDEMNFILIHSADFSKDDFLGNDMFKRACVRSLEIIGEAVKNLPREFTSKYPNIEWNLIARTRDVLIHHYFGVNYNIVWDIVQNDIPVLKKHIDQILKESNQDQ